MRIGNRVSFFGNQLYPVYTNTVTIVQGGNSPLNRVLAIMRQSRIQSVTEQNRLLPIQKQDRSDEIDG